MASPTTNAHRSGSARRKLEGEDSDRLAHQHHDDDMDAANVDAKLLLGELRAATAEGYDDSQDSDLPPLPGDDDDDSFLRSTASFLDRTDAEAEQSPSDGHETLDEGALRRHFMDVESSFMPDLPPLPQSDERAGVDDTYVNFGSSTEGPPVSQLLGISNHDSSPRPSGGASRGSGLRQEYHHSGDEDEHGGNEDGHGGNHSFDKSGEASVTEVQPSSPAAAAAERTILRSNADNAPTLYHYEERNGDVSPHRWSSRSPANADGYLSPLPHNVDLPPSEPSTASSQNSLPSAPPARLSHRPSYFSSSTRQVSQRSYPESVLSPDDSNLNADYALQTGGAIPSDTDNNFLGHHSNRSGYGLSRLPSFGSVASAMSRESNDDRPIFNRGVSGMSVLAGLRADRQLDRLEEEDRSSVLSDPITPRPPQFSTFAAPTDTVIAQHVQNIHVPDTVAREYHQRNRSMSPEKTSRNGSTIFSQSRPRSGNLTLKEQNSKIDKLTKENFDLKLKIHFLDQALQNRSDEGVKDMINKNVQFQTDLANERKESQTLRKRIRELERKLKEQEQELADAKKGAEQKDDSGYREDMEYEITQLQEEVDRCQVKITRLSADNMAKEIEKRKMAEYISALNDRKGNQQSAAEEESEMWKDLLTTETARREQAEDDARKLREEIIMIRSEKAAEASSKGFTFNRLRRQKNFDSRSMSRESKDSQEQSEAVTASSVTLNEQLRHEMEELRRDLGAQTSMLTSRNKERERLQQEIEDLKLQNRKGDGARSVAGDSIFERSISRQHQRVASRASAQTAHTAATPMSDGERDEWERRENILRDQNASLRMDYQDLEREFRARDSFIQERDTYILELEQAVEMLETNYGSAVQDLHALQKERDDALQAMDDREREAARLKKDFETLKDEAVTAISELEGDLDAREEEVKRLVSDLKDRNDDFNALQRELRDLNNSLMQLEDDRAAAMRKIEALEIEIDETNQELESLDHKVRETNQKNERLEVQQESLHSEISFLREEQEGDKIKIGDLENSLNAAQQSIQDEKEKMQELEDSLVEERRQRDILDNQSKQEVQKILNDLNTENSKSKDEVRALRRAVTTKEVEAAAFKKSLDEVDNNLRRILGDSNGRRASWFSDIERLQNDLESTLDQLEKTKSTLAERDRLLRSRDILLESSALESQRVSDLLEKERAARKRDLHQYEQSQRGHSVNNRTVAQNESRMLELESARSQDRRKMAQLEQQYRDQLAERNNLLLALWNRLSTLCGVEWARSHSLINGEQPSVDAIARSLPTFNKNIIEAVRTVELILGSFKQRIRGVEKTLMKDYQTLSNNLDGRVKRMDFLERAVKDAQTQIEEQAREQAQLRLQYSSRTSAKNAEEITRLNKELKVVRTELKFYKQHPSNSTPQPRDTTLQHTQSHQGSPDSKRGSMTSILNPKNMANSLMRHHSSTAVEQLQHQQASSTDPTSRNSSIVIATPPIQPSEQRWIHRLKELERRLKAEREARLLDRRGARQRLEERSAENEELRLQLEREKDRRGSVVGSVMSDEDTADDSSRTVRDRDGRVRDGSLD